MFLCLGATNQAVGLLNHMEARLFWSNIHVFLKELNQVTCSTAVHKMFALPCK